MTYLFKVIFASFIAIFAENTIFHTALGTSTLIRISRSRSNVFGFGLCVTYFTAVTGIMCYFISRLTENFAFKEMFLPLMYVAAVGILYVATLLIMWKTLKEAFGRMRKYVHISAFNCAVLGAMFLNDKYCTTLAEYVCHGIAVGLGFVLAIYLVAIVYDKIYSDDVPYCFRGYPLLLIYIGILSMAFYGLSGYGVNF